MVVLETLGGECETHSKIVVMAVVLVTNNGWLVGWWIFCNEVGIGSTTRCNRRTITSFLLAYTPIYIYIY